MLTSFGTFGSSMKGVMEPDNKFLYAVSNDKTLRRINSTTGAEEWVDTNFTNTVYWVRTNKFGNPYTAARGTNDVRKYDNDGNELWRFSGHTNIARAVAIDDDLYVYSCSNDETVRKIDPTGVEVWSLNLGMQLLCLDIDSAGNIYAGGSKIFKISNDGVLLWTSPSLTYNQLCLTVDSSNNVVSSGLTGVITKYSSAGVLVFSVPLGSQTWAVTSDNLDNIYVGTTSEFLFKLDPDGVEIWSHETFNASIYSIHYDDGEDVIYYGTSGAGAVVAKFDVATMSEIWTYSGFTSNVNSIGYEEVVII